MSTSRRSFLQAATALGASLGLSGCEWVISQVSTRLGQSVPAHISIASGANIDPDFHFLSRATYGLWPGDLDNFRTIGKEAWLEQQLHPDQIDDTACDLRARRLETVHLEPGLCYEFKKNVLRDDLTRHTLLRAVYSKRQLLEVMTGFWSDHLNIYFEKGDCAYLKTADDRLVIRKHALGNFKDLIRASATSPAMLVYLDGKENMRKSPTERPNENYARELLELHTLGVHGGYTQNDVMEAARCLTGWRLHSPWQRGIVYFDQSRHDDGEKHVLGETITAGGGTDDVDRLVEIACSHPSTAQHIGFKMARWFVCDEPPQPLVDRLANKFTQTRGEIKPVLKELFASDEFLHSAGNKFKRPFHYVVSALRATAADTYAHDSLLHYLSRMGQAPFQHPTPDGYADVTEPWVGTLLWRWNFAVALQNEQFGPVQDRLKQIVDATTAERAAFAEHERLFAHFIGRAPNDNEKRALAQLKSSSASHNSLALILSSPAFQRC